jgi:hypothetical protein
MMFLANRVFEVLINASVKRKYISENMSSLLYIFIFSIGSIFASYSYFAEPKIARDDIISLYAHFSHLSHNEVTWHWCSLIAFDIVMKKFNPQIDDCNY